MLNRTGYLTLIEEIRNTEAKSLDEFIIKRLEPLRLENANFIETLYKDIYYLLEDIDKKGEGDLAIENGDLVIEDGGIKLTGYQSRLHSLSIWLHMEMVKKFSEDSPFQFIEKMENFQKNFVKKANYTPEYRAELDKIKRSLKKERKQNLNEKDTIWEKIWSSDNFELKPNIAGLGINLNEIINRFKKSKPGR